jgi:hypothetical protein
MQGDEDHGIQGASAAPTGLSPSVEPASGLAGSAASIPSAWRIATTVFTPEPRTSVKSVRHINYTCGPARYAELQSMAKAAGICLKELIRQMVDFAVAHHIPASAIEARRAETEGLGAQHESAIPKGDAQ